MEPIILASASPRRQEILKLLNIPFVPHPSQIEENIPTGMKIENIPEYLASKKVESVAKSISSNQEIPWILGADTIVTYHGKIYGKPKDRDDAKKILKTLQGTSHKVITGIALYNGKYHELITRTSINKITFSNISDEEIEWYLNSGEWYGVAGAYRIQGLGSCFIKKIDGTESSVMGLPIFELCDMLREQNYPFFK
jgi:septum formation protein